ncbi:hypothetical protein EV702DRAFT_1250538 [Suillus placidus]|uniref:Uncharacterized protein n=1 Tax=Suillus placidus TaxID=48579 RepID=A0A9P7A2D3_9AGAM|nr:hypothetical protein EV702DRAFT_1250538 [Suillus placidus]
MPSTSNTGSSSGSRSTTSTSSLQNKHSSPILKFSVRAGNSPVTATPNKPRLLPSVASPPLTSVVPTSSPILRGSSPILKSSSPIPKDNSLIPKSSSPIPKNNLPVKSGSPVSRGSSLTADALLTTGNQHGSLKRTHQYTLLEDDGLEDGEGFPIKKSKTLLTTFTSDRSADATIYFTKRMLELSRVSRQALAARMEYQRLRTEELGLITSIVHDELEESQSRLIRADLQIGSLRNDLYDAGVSVIGNKGRQCGKEVRNGRIFSSLGDHEAADDGSDPCLSDLNECDGSVDGKSQASEC